MEVRVRFAPSPTGPLHIGGARSALFNYLLARKCSGKFIVRSEDTDLERSSLVSERNILEALRWLNISWDEGIEVGGDYGPYRQTERLELYREFTDKLFQSGQAYFCYCSEDELEQERQELISRGQPPRYMGKCRNLTAEERAEKEALGVKPVVRFRVPEGKQIHIKDLVRGDIIFDSDGIGDYVIVKSDGIPTYNFAVVVDDTTMKISHVVRGEEHLSNTPRQVLIYQALGLQSPHFAHISLILNTEGKKMSKRDGDTAVIDYRAKGYLPEAVVNFIVLLGWSPPGEQEFFSMTELSEIFSLERVSKSPAVFDLNKLKWINAHYLKLASRERIAELALPYLREMGVLTGELNSAQRQWLLNFVATVIDHLSCVSEVSDFVHYVHGSDVQEPDEEARQMLRGEQVPAVLNLFKQRIIETETITADSAKLIMKQITKELKVGGKLVFMPVRIALTGQMHGPELNNIIALLGKENTLKRLETGAAWLRD
ncbi:MAG: glutamate--tRNA ligase [Desulfitobacteriaceae bacterium]|nr:glutamate--tRNA ligase [Desulfitobacteriaceae bacterium]MDD4346138.1 glutamate--tRNA ligase [Desulfitobacteriaceae bacterium]MDD4400804.1 glutamate--tRNA ligase [Desulfitobacteriaceae bacterium]